MNGANKWNALYERRRTSLEKALKRIRRGGRIFIGSGCAEPLSLSRGLIEHAHLFADNPIIHILTHGPATYTRPEYAENFRLNAFFIGNNVREAVQDGRADYTPIFLSEIPALFASGQMPLDAALISVSPPDAQGYCSLGVSVDIVRAAARNTRLVIAEVNSLMPRTFGDSFIHVNDIDAIIEAEHPLPELHLPEPDSIASRIGAHVARLVKDGATLQLGIGGIPNAVLSQLKTKNDLGVHTELLSDGFRELVQNGNINGRRKTLHPHAIVASFCMGARPLYDWVDENPHVLFYPSDYTNDPGIIRRNDNMVAINSAIAVDLTGQVCADSIGSRFYSGIGGQVDFMRGAARSKGGRPIIVLPSTAKLPTGETVSRLVPHLDEGAGVVTSRGDVHYVVTEHGVAYLHGKSVTERARALIEIAHPDFRNELLDGAKARRYVYGDLGRYPARDVYPAHLEACKNVTHPQHGGIEITIRPIRSSDERRLQDFFYSHTEETVQYRYGYAARTMTHQRALSLVELDYQKRLALVALYGEPGEEQIIAVGRYELDETTNLAEVAFVVHENFRGLGLTCDLLQSLTREAKTQGISGFTAQVLSENKPMLHIFQKILGNATEEKWSHGEVWLLYRFESGA
jgi:acyl-CoA hydrolase/RimJ/RimL family protein N-acetyltransferase